MFTRNTWTPNDKRSLRLMLLILLLFASAVCMYALLVSRVELVAPIAPIAPITPIRPLLESTPLVFIVISASRPLGIDYASALLHSIVQSGERAGFRLRVLLYDADPPAMRRAPSWFDALPASVEVHRASSDALAELATVDVSTTRDRHHDPMSRILWRTKGAKDLHCVLKLAHTQSALGWKHVVVLQDDVQLSSTFFDRIKRIVTMPPVPWLAWALFHAAVFDHGREYDDGATYAFEACGQAIMYQTSEMDGFVDYVARNWRSDPDDWQLRDYQRQTNALVRVAQPSLVQHIGSVSSLASKASQGGGVASGCVARDFVV